MTIRVRDSVVEFGGGFEADAEAASEFFNTGQEEIGRLPPRAIRTSEAQASAEAVHGKMRAARVAFLRRHAGELYARLTDDQRRFVRIEQLVYDAAAIVPGLVPTRAQIQAEREHPQKDKEG